MPRRPRLDGRNTWHHVGNRSIGRRPIFENRRDVRYLLSRLAWMVRAGRIEIHAYAVLQNHFHLLVRSVTGELSATMQWVLDQYARWFNRSRGRDGHVFQGRFWSELVDSATYWETLVYYIDQNPVSAGLVASPSHYPYGSAYHHARKTPPIWLSGTLVRTLYDPQGPDRVVRIPEPVVRRRSRGRAGGRDPLDDLIRGTPESIREWMYARARQADREPVGVVLVDPATVIVLVEGVRVSDPEWKPGGGGDGRRRPGWRLLAVGLLRLAAGLELEDISRLLGMSGATVGRILRDHRELLSSDPAYAQRACGLLREALADDYGSLTLPARILDLFEGGNR